MGVVAFTAGRDRYAGLNAAMIALWVGTWIVLAKLNAVGGPLSLLVAFALLWNVVSYARIAETRLWWLHAAPWATIAGLYLLFQAFASGQAQYAGLPPPPGWKVALQFTGYPLVLAWPAATITLSLAPGRRA